MPTTTILVTGGAGFIGSHTVERLLEDGHHVRVLDNFSSGKPTNLPRHDHLRIVHGDIRRMSDVQGAMQGVSHCIHLAAQVSVGLSVAHPQASAEHNVTGTLNVMQAGIDSGIARLVYASSAAVYGTPERLPLSEDCRSRPLSPYGLEKAINERYAALLEQLHGLSSLGLRYFNVYGPRQDPQSPYAGVISLFVDRLLAHRPATIFGDGGQTRDFVYVEDVARSNVAALFNDRRGVCNVATQRRASLLELVATLQELIGTSQAPEFAPPRAEDIRHSQGCNERLLDWLGTAPQWSLDDGLRALLCSVKNDAIAISA